MYVHYTIILYCYKLLWQSFILELPYKNRKKLIIKNNFCAEIYIITLFYPEKKTNFSQEEFEDLILKQTNKSFKKIAFTINKVFVDKYLSFNWANERNRPFELSLNDKNLYFLFEVQKNKMFNNA